MHASFLGDEFALHIDLPECVQTVSIKRTWSAPQQDGRRLIEVEVLYEQQKHLFYYWSEEEFVTHIEAMVSQLIRQECFEV